MKSLSEYISEGAWGYKPFQSDDSLDTRDAIIMSIFEKIYNELDKASDNYIYDYACCFVYFFEKFNKDVPFEFKSHTNTEEKLAYLCINRLNYLLEENTWINGWGKPEEITSEITKLRNKIQNYIDTYKFGK